MRILVVDCGSSKVPHIGFMLSDIGLLFDTIKLNDITNPVTGYKGIIISGAPILLTETNPAPFLSHFKHLLDSNVPLLGICFGHQLLGLSFKAEISRCKEDRDIQTIQLKGQDPLFLKFGIWETFMEDHCECISLPAEFQLLGSSAICDVEAMRHSTRPWYGVQFHPEVSGENGKKLLANFIKICKG